jgi:hypothetical protein
MTTPRVLHRARRRCVGFVPHATAACVSAAQNSTSGGTGDLSTNVFLLPENPWWTSHLCHPPPVASASFRAAPCRVALWDVPRRADARPLAPVRRAHAAPGAEVRLHHRTGPPRRPAVRVAARDGVAGGWPGQLACPGRGATRGSGLRPAVTRSTAPNDGLLWLCHPDNKLSRPPANRSGRTTPTPLVAAPPGQQVVPATRVAPPAPVSYAPTS